VFPDRIVVVARAAEGLAVSIQDRAALDAAVPDCVRGDRLTESVHGEGREDNLGRCGVAGSGDGIGGRESGPAEADILRCRIRDAHGEARNRTVLDPPLASDSCLRRCVHGRCAGERRIKIDRHTRAGLGDDREACLTVTEDEFALDVHVPEELCETLDRNVTHDDERA
jgi:hypothetical protein